MPFFRPDRTLLTIRAKFLLTYLGLALITACLGFSALHIIVETGRLALQSFDTPLGTVSDTRKAEADFAEMRLAYARHEAIADPARRAQLGVRFDAVSERMERDLDSLRERSGSGQAAAARSVVEDFGRWQTLSQQDMAAPASREAAMDSQAEALIAKLSVDRASRSPITWCTTGPGRSP